MKKLLAAIGLSVIFITVQAQMLEGHVYDMVDGKKLPATGVLVGVLHAVNATTTDDKGYYMLMDLNLKRDTIIITGTGYKADTIAINNRATIDVALRALQLNEVTIESKKANRLNTATANAEMITSGDLVRDACCSLSESFESTATVDVTFTDAVSGAREIRMLGLDGIYTQKMVENITDIRALGNAFGMNYIPGPWVYSIQLNKGAGSVINGYESITGQINMEYKKPLTTDKLFVNLYVNQDLRTELNIISAQKISSKWSSLTAAHGTYNWLKMDLNKDGFMDNPLVKNINLFNRFTYQSGKVFSLWTGATFNYEDRQGGSIHFNPSVDKMEQDYWGLRLTTARVDAFAKTAFNLPDGNFIGIQYKYIFQHQYGYLGRRNYDGLQHFGYLNFIYQKNFGANENVMKWGASIQTEKVAEQFDTTNLNRLEIVPGIFGELNLNMGRKKQVSLTAGLRLDDHNMYGLLITPRLHLKWNITDDLSFRVSGGRGYRTATLFAENFGWLANNRKIVLGPNLGIEQAWNYGGGLNYNFVLKHRQGNISIDFYRTDFINRIIADLGNPRQLYFYNTPGKSFGNALQAEVKYEVIKGFDIKIAYKYEPNKTDYKGGRLVAPLRPQHRGLLTLQYTTRNKHWRFNTGLNWIGKTRIPNTSANDLVNQRSTASPDYLQLNAQVTFKWKKWEVYAGAENMTNFTQKNPIIAANQPFSNQFDASLIWGPLRGAMAFAGFRFTLK